MIRNAILTKIIEEQKNLTIIYKKLHMVLSSLNDLNAQLLTEPMPFDDFDLEYHGECFNIKLNHDPEIEPRFWTKITKVNQI